MGAMAPPRQRLQALAQGRPDDQAIAVPLAMQVAARIQERDWEAFTCDPTQLANGLRDLVDACAPDGIPVTMPEVLLDAADPVGGIEAQTALEATRRLRSSMGERVALVACLPGPAALPNGGDDVLELGKAFLGAGADAIVVLEHHGGTSALSTLANVARFYQAAALGCCDRHGLPVVERVALAEPRPATGMVMTTDTLPRDTDVSVLEDWVEAVRG